MRDSCLQFFRQTRTYLIPNSFVWSTGEWKIPAICITFHEFEKSLNMEDLRMGRAGPR